MRQKNPSYRYPGTYPPRGDIRTKDLSRTSGEGRKKLEKKYKNPREDISEEVM